MSTDARNLLIQQCKALLDAYKNGDLGICTMPEDSSPKFSKEQLELKLAYFTLPMSLNYQRDSYKLWDAALKTFNDPETHDIFSIKSSATISDDLLRMKLLKHRLALQPNKHINTWKVISKTIYFNWKTIEQMFKEVDNDFLILRELIQHKYKKGFPYLSGPKIFNYWSFIISTYGGIPLKNSAYIDVAPDTHITKCSVLLGVITKEEADKLSKEEISRRWRNLLLNSGINPIDMHPPLWFWSRNGFLFKLPNK